jgi:hypothetical protein
VKNRRNYYRILQVQPDAPDAIIRAGYRTLMLELKQHPDLGGATSDAALLNEAYRVLSNPALRAAYDQRLFARCGKKAFSQQVRQQALILCPVCKRPLERAPLPGERCPKCRSPLESEKPGEHAQAFRRTISRIRKEEPVTYSAGGYGEAGRGMMLDISPQGIRFCCFEKLSIGAVLKINCRLFEASAEVTNVCEQHIEGRRVYATGASFLAVTFLDNTGSFLSATV